MASMNPFEGLLGGGQVAGGLLSPEMSMASALLQASGPSRMPVSMGQALAQGIDAYGRAAAQQNAQQMQQKLLDAKIGNYDLERQKLETEVARSQRLQALAAQYGSDREGLYNALLQAGEFDLAKKVAPEDERTTLMKNLEAQGLQPGSPAYAAAVQAYLAKTDSITIGAADKPLGVGDSLKMRNAKGETPPPGMTATEAFNAGYRAVDTTEAGEIRESEEKLAAFSQALESYETRLRQMGPTIVPSGDKLELKAAYTGLLLEAKELANLGVLAGPDMDLMESQMADPTALMTQQYTGEQLAQQLKVIREKLDAAKARLDRRRGGGRPSAAGELSPDEQRELEMLRRQQGGGGTVG